MVKELKKVNKYNEDGELIFDGEFINDKILINKFKIKYDNDKIKFEYN